MSIGELGFLSVGQMLGSVGGSPASGFGYF